MSSRLVVVDDTDPAIQWGPGWTAQQGVLDDPASTANRGPPFNGTEHMTDRNSTVSLNFTGTSITVVGDFYGNNDTGTPDPYWDCLLDGQSIPRSDYSTSFISHWIFCNRANLPDGEHTFTLNTISSKARMLSVDQFRYIASPAANIENAKIQIDASSLSYSTGWASNSLYSMGTYQTGASAVLDFVGVSVQWYGFAPGLPESNGPSTAAYRIDGGEQINFTLAGPVNSFFTNALLLEIPQLSPGHHQLKVVHYGSTVSTPLTIDYIVIQNATLPAGSSTSSTSSSPSTASVSSSTSTTTGTGLPATGGQAEKSPPVGAIVGGVIGGIALLVLIGILLLLLRRRRQVGPKSFDSHTLPDMSDITRPTPLPNPYMKDGCDPSVVYRPYSPNGQVNPRSWQSSQQVLAQNQSQAQLLNHSRSRVQLQPAQSNPYIPNQSSLLISPTPISNVATSPEPASSSSRPGLGEEPPPQYSEVVPPRIPGVILT